MSFPRVSSGMKSFYECIRTIKIKSLSLSMQIHDLNVLSRCKVVWNNGGVNDTVSACNVVNVDLKRLNKGWAFMRVVVIIRPKCAVVTR